MSQKSWIASLFIKLLVIVTLLSREDILTAYGSGTGIL